MSSGGSRICEKGGGGGGGGAGNLNSPPGLKKSLSGGGGGGGGGDSDTFFPRNFLGRHLHYWVGVPSAYQTDLRGGKQKKKKKKKKSPKKLTSSERRGGPRPIRPPPPPGSATGELKRYIFSRAFPCTKTLFIHILCTLLTQEVNCNLL